MNEEEKKREKETTLESITGEPGSHLAGEAIGTGAAGLAGAGIGAVLGGPVGAVIGTVIGAALGAEAGHAIAEKVDPAAEHAYWNEHHHRQPYAETDTFYQFEQYQFAYRIGVEGYKQFGHGKKFDEVVQLLKEYYVQHSSPEDVPWEKARPAVEAAYERVQDQFEKPGTPDENAARSGQEGAETNLPPQNEPRTSAENMP